jgi:hypothetical protein
MLKNIVVGFVAFMVGCSGEIEIEGMFCAQSVEIEDGCWVEVCDSQDGEPMLLVNGETWLNCSDRDCTDQVETAEFVCGEVSN